jgi:hypothetical protein
VSDLKEFEVIKTTLGSFKSTSDSFNLSPDIDEGLRVSRSWDSRILEIGKHEIEFRAHKKIHALLEVPGVLPPMLLSQGIPFGHGLSFCCRELEDMPDFFFKEKDLFYRGSFVDFHHFWDEQMFFFSPSVHMLQQSPFHLPEFFSVEGPTFSFERLTKLDQSILEVIPEPFYDVEVIVLEGGFRPDFTDDFGKGGPEVKDNAVRMDAPILKLSEEFFSDPAAIEPRNGFDIEDSNLFGISGDLIISASSSGHIFIEAESSGEMELSEDLWEIVLGGQTFFPSIQGGFGPVGIKTSVQPFSDSS